LIDATITEDPAKSTKEKHAQALTLNASGAAMVLVGSLCRDVNRIADALEKIAAQKESAS
jgi:hypothetical protein